MIKKILFITFVALCTAPIYAQLIEANNAEYMPLFEGCDNNRLSLEGRIACSNKNLATFINRNIIYPDSAKKAKVEGAVVISFAITENGEVADPHLLRSLGYGCDEEALRVISIMPNWTPAYNKSTPVRVRLSLPIYFSLKSFDEKYKPKVFNLTWGKAYGSYLEPNMVEELVNEPITVRDAFGKAYKVEVLKLLYEYKDKVITLVSQDGSLDKKMLKLLKKLKPGSLLTVIATIEDGTGRNETERTYEVPLPKD
jgi:TonB family protein